MLALFPFKPVHWICNSKRINRLIDFTQPFNVHFCSIPINYELWTVYKNSFGGSTSSGIDDSGYVFLEVNIIAWNVTEITIEACELIPELPGSLAVNEKLTPAHIRAKTIAIITPTDNGYMAFIVQSSDDKAASAAIRNTTGIKGAGEVGNTERQRFTNQFEEHCCRIMGGVIPAPRTISRESSCNFDMCHNVRGHSMTTSPAKLSLKVQLSPEFEILTDKLSDIKSIGMPKQLSERFLKIFERLINLGQLFGETTFIESGNDAAAAGVGVIALNPSDRLIRLFSAVLTGDRDFHAIEHDLSLFEHDLSKLAEQD